MTFGNTPQCSYSVYSKPEIRHKIPLLTAARGRQHTQEEKHDHSARPEDGAEASRATASWERSGRDAMSWISETPGNKNSQELSVPQRVEVAGESPRRVSVIVNS